jgi:hypothetical protein
MPADLPSDFFSLESMVRLAGASVAVVVVTNTVRKLAGLDSLWVGFGLSIVIVFVDAYDVGRLPSLALVLMALVNSCLLFSTAFDMSASGGVLAGARVIAGVARDAPARRAKPWAASWLEALVIRSIGDDRTLNRCVLRSRPNQRMQLAGASVGSARPPRSAGAGGDHRICIAGPTARS